MTRFKQLQKKKISLALSSNKTRRENKAALKNVSFFRKTLHSFEMTCCNILYLQLTLFANKKDFFTLLTVMLS